MARTCTIHSSDLPVRTDYNVSREWNNATIQKVKCDISHLARVLPTVSAKFPWIYVSLKLTYWLKLDHMLTVETHY